MGQSVEMCAIYKYGNDDVLRVNAIFLLSFQFDAFCFCPILPQPYGCAWVCCSFIRLEVRVITYFLLLLFSSSYFLCFAFLSRIYCFYGIASYRNDWYFAWFLCFAPLEFLIFHKSLILLFQRLMNGHLTYLTITTLAGNQGNWA